MRGDFLLFRLSWLALTGLVCGNLFRAWGALGLLVAPLLSLVPAFFLSEALYGALLWWTTRYHRTRRSKPVPPHDPPT